MKNYLSPWQRDIETKTSGLFPSSGMEWGVYEQYQGPSYWFAKVLISLEPNDALEVVSALNDETENI